MELRPYTAINPKSSESFARSKAQSAAFRAALIFPPSWENRIDTTQLAVQWAMVAIVVLGLVWTLGDKRSVTSRDEE